MTTQTATLTVGRIEFTMGPSGPSSYHSRSGITLHNVNSSWSIADRDGWLPGAFDSPETAVAGRRLAIKRLDAFAEMQGRVNSITGENREITQADLDGLTR